MESKFLKMARDRVLQANICALVAMLAGGIGLLSSLIALAVPGGFTEIYLFVIGCMVLSSAISANKKIRWSATLLALAVILLARKDYKDGQLHRQRIWNQTFNDSTPRRDPGTAASLKRSTDDDRSPSIPDAPPPSRKSD